MDESGIENLAHSQEDDQDQSLQKNSGPWQIYLGKEQILSSKRVQIPQGRKVQLHLYSLN